MSWEFDKMCFKEQKRCGANFGPYLASEEQKQKEAKCLKEIYDNLPTDERGYKYFEAIFYDVDNNRFPRCEDNNTLVHWSFQLDTAIGNLKTRGQIPVFEVDCMNNTVYITLDKLDELLSK